MCSKLVEYYPKFMPSANLSNDCLYHNLEFPITIYILNRTQLTSLEHVAKFQCLLLVLIIDYTHLWYDILPRYLTG